MTTHDSSISLTRTSLPMTWQVEVPGRTRTHHTVTVRPAYLADLGLPNVAPESILRAAFSFLLERESNASILARFDLQDIERYFPEFRSEIVRQFEP